MILLKILCGYLLLSTAWTCIWMGLYWLLWHKNDHSGDGGIAIYFISIVPWLLITYPYWVYKGKAEW